MELALDIPEILDEILRLATPSAQAAAAQTCQRWSHHSLRWLWRHMDSYYPLLEILSPLVGSGSWYRKFSSDLSTSDWNRFSRYAAYIFSIHHISIYPFWVGQRSPQRLWETFLLHHPEPASMFSNLTEIKWNVETDEDLLSVMVFLAPSVISLNLMCGRSIGDKCIEILEVLGQRKIYLTKFTFAMLTPNKTVMDRLPAVLAGQTKLTAVALSPYFATQAVVTVLGQLPSLREYTSNLVGKSLEPMVGFDWQEGAFPLLERFTLCSSITHASDLMTKPHQPQLRHFTLVFQEPFHYTMLPAFCSNLSALQSCITTITLVLYSETGATGSLSFDLIRPLLRCAALLYLRLTSHLVLAYDDEDIAIMASSWPNLRVLRLCPDPVPQTGPDAGQPLRTVGTFTHSFSQLVHLAIYINSLDVGVAQSGVPHRRLATIDFGTSPAPPGSAEAASLYLANIMEPGGNLRGGRRVDRMTSMGSMVRDTAECCPEGTFWYNVSKRVEIIHSSQQDSNAED